jgi:hypothetical protein
MIRSAVKDSPSSGDPALRDSIDGQSRLPCFGPAGAAACPPNGFDDQPAQHGNSIDLQHFRVVRRRSYARIFTQPHLRGAVAADGLAELQVRYPNVPIVHCDSRKLAEQWTYRFLAAAYEWAHDEPAVQARIGGSEVLDGPPAPSPSSAELRAWARANGIAVSQRGRIGREVLQAWQAVAGSASAGG